jgi:5-oxopent-3-ene-1,2,5-tricarboxylate decarboxylase / 2-hydroxyhepta-2,4-diene-1,7-dioate isomerase
MNPLPTSYWPAGTVYGTLLNFRQEYDLMAVQMTQPPYKAPPKAPVLYIKTANTWSANGAGVPVPPALPQIEVGASIGMIIQAVGLAGIANDAAILIANYILMNDFSVPHASFFRPPVKFKCADGFLGIGSSTVSPALAGDPALFRLDVHINGVLKQTVDYSQTVRNAARLLADVAEFMTLRQGDVLMLGCDCLPGGGRPLARLGDRIDISSPSHPALGVLSNTLIAEVA